MIKTKIFLLALLTFGLSISGIIGKQFSKGNSLFGQFEKLIFQHDNFLRSQNNSFSTFEKDFFSNFNFIHFGTTKRFFANLNRTKNGSFYGNIRVTHAKMSIINGKRYSVHYTYQSDGKNLKMIKYINNNGKVLKANYIYDLAKKSLKTMEYNDNKLLGKKLYNI